jgi:hypothetical protein
LTWIKTEDRHRHNSAGEGGKALCDVMTRSVITATPETPLGEIAMLLERNRIKRVPIVQNGKVVGIVSRANLLQALAGMPAKNTAASAGDSQIRDEVLSRLNAQLWWPSMLVTVRHGTVDVWGFVTSDDEKKATRIAVESIPGVKAIKRSSDNSATRDCNGVMAHRSHRHLKWSLERSI